MENMDYNKASLNDLIFEGRNKKFGAYEIRRIYDEYVLRAMGIALFGFALFTVGPIIWEKIKPEEEIVEQDIVTVDPKMIEPPPINPKTPPPPPLPSSTQGASAASLEPAAPASRLENSRGSSGSTSVGFPACWPPGTLAAYRTVGGRHCADVA